jgi:hypothetical protein
LAILRTCVARCFGRLTLCRTASVALTEPLCTSLNQASYTGPKYPQHQHPKTLKPHRRPPTDPESASLQVF